MRRGPTPPCRADPSRKRPPQQGGTSTAGAVPVRGSGEIAFFRQPYKLWASNSAPLAGMAVSETEKMKVGIIGWRGMVGSVLRERMRSEGDFTGVDACFYSTSNAGGRGPHVGAGTT